MRVEWLIGFRYLSATRSSGAPSVITVISAIAVGVGVAALILVLSILGGFQGDLRNKILATKAHLLVTGPSLAPLDESEGLLEALTRLDGVRGVSPFVESDVMIASVSNYSGVALRGIQVERLVEATQVGSFMQEGRLEWLNEPSASLRVETGGDIEMDELRHALRSLQQEMEELEAIREGVNSRIEDAVRNMHEAASPQGSGAVVQEEADREEPAEAVGPPSLDDLLAAPVGPPALGDILGDPVGPPGLDDLAGEDARPRSLPGIVIGSELKEALHVELGDQVQLINPDGDDGPMGPIPRAWPYRVVGVFHSGLYEFDSSMVYMLLPEARSFLSLGVNELSGVEIRLANADAAVVMGGLVEQALVGAGRQDLEVKTWMDLNERLFAALMLERLVIGLLLMIIVLVASFAIVCVLIMIVIQRSEEIGILRAMGASGAMIRSVFVVQGMSIGVAGLVGGLLVGLGLVGYLIWFGFPLDPSVYYIDRVPVELRWPEVLWVATGALGISAVATILPSMQAARLDPAAALRHD